MVSSSEVCHEANRIADAVAARLCGLVGATVAVIPVVELEIPSGAPDNVVRTVTENARTLKFKEHSGFEDE